jgi:ABC-2 type transport system permease protein
MANAVLPTTTTTTTAARTAPSVSWLGASWTLYTLTLRQHLHGKRWLVMTLLFLLPAGLAVVIRSTSPQVPPAALEFVLAMMFIPQALLPIIALLYASGIIQDEQEEQTITYLLLRPIPKWAIYTLKLLAAMTTTAVLVAVFTAFTYLAIYVGAGAPASEVAVRYLKAASIHALAVVTYCSVFGLMSLLTKRVLVFGILYTAIFEGLLANLPFGIRLVTVIYYTRLIAYRTMTFHVQRPNGRSHDVAALAWQLAATGDPGLAEHPQLGTCIAVLLIASVACTAIAGWLCSQREFHVKTPEKE